ncbi:MAG: phosphogluconate dehydrogenase (NADP(+)-dependent, decarboxylating) [Desulfobacca sp. RBG_16_60_12]|nr:MAG: phosphogluconate dehydrogenase (NADP(+)-dependent, decarboxylating) [Desulfobacca sp. RBG_16_60_12]
MTNQGCDIGLIGLGTMGRNFVLNMADHGFAVAAYNRTAEKTRDFMDHEVGARPIQAGYDLEEFVGLVRRPRALILLVAAGDPVDAVIRELLPLLSPGDLIIDGGNSHFTDTNRRGRFLSGKKLNFMGMGISGGEAGARYGPSLMPGGSRETYDRVAPILEAAAAHVNGDPCVTYLGPGSAGHYVKMVHNGIEYGLMELIVETYDLLKRGLGLTPAELARLYDRWNQAELNSFLLEITAKIFSRQDDQTGKPLIDLILDKAKQKGTGMWTSWDAMDLQVGTPTIDVAVVMRDMSGYKEERQAAAQVLAGPPPAFPGDREGFIGQVKNALYAGMIATYAQGMALLQKASATYAYGLDLEAVARIWRGGCIIRAALLEDIRAAYKARADLPNLLMDPRLGQEFLKRQADLREVVKMAATLGLPAPGFMATLSYFDAYRSAVLPANLIQAQRDCFGAHTYERLDAPGTFHTEWEEV